MQVTEEYVEKFFTVKMVQKLVKFINISYSFYQKISCQSTLMIRKPKSDGQPKQMCALTESSVLE